MASYVKLVITLADDSVVTYAENDIVSADLVEETNPVSATLPISTMSATIHDVNDQFAVFGDSGLEERLPVMIYEVIDGLEYFIGKHYLDNWEIEESNNLLKIESVDIIGVLASTDFDGRFYEDFTPFETILKAVLGTLEVDYSIPTSLRSVTLKGWIAPETCREALQQLCFASGAMVITSRSEGLMFKVAPLPHSQKYHELDIGLNDKFVDQPLSKLPLVTDIELVAHDYVKSGETETIFEDTLPVGVHKIVFQNPYFDVVTSGQGYVPEYLITHGGDHIVTHEGDQIEVGGEFTYGPNWVILNIMEAGQVTVTGTKWVDNQRPYVFRETGVGSTTKRNQLSVQGATLVSVDNAQRVLSRLRDYSRQRYKYTFTLVPKTEYRYGDAEYGDAYYGWSAVYVDIGQMISAETVRGKKVRAVIERAETNLAGGYLKRIVATGVEREA